MAVQRVVIGVDSSTQATKALAVDLDTGQVLGEGRAPHTVSAGPGRESDPALWWSALCAAIERTGYAERAEAISIGGQQHGLVTLDAAGEPVRPALLWNDVRSAPQAAALVERFGERWWAERIGSVPNASFTAAKWAWLREHEPRNADRVAAVRLPHDYLTERLTGVGVTDRGDTSGTAWWTPSGYAAEVLDAIGLNSSALPTLAPSDRAAGHTRAGTPLRQGIPVGVGTGDNMAAALGLGLEPGTPVLSLGTSGTVYARTGARPHDPTGVVAGFADAGTDWLPLACTLNCTQAIDRIAALFGLDREAVEPGGDAVVLPYLDGERTPQLPLATGLIHGLRHDTTPGQILQAAYDGAAFSLLDALDRVLNSGGSAGAATGTGSTANTPGTADTAAPPTGLMEATGSAGASIGAPGTANTPGAIAATSTPTGPTDSTGPAGTTIGTRSTANTPGAIAATSTPTSPTYSTGSADTPIGTRGGAGTPGVIGSASTPTSPTDSTDMEVSRLGEASGHRSQLPLNTADPDAPILLIGGGARGTAWQQTVLRLSGRPIRIPPATELVALGAAAQAAALLTGEDPYAVARRWRTAEGPLLQPIPRDTAASERIAATLHAADPLLTTPLFKTASTL
ncbi:FGGY family carbohydrate kinase [Nocardia alni]|uniref:FGGY family carbohydrate kinase n=1 Tax=Nocardia alni TaxID=2815723 RepID=UPI001C23EAB1|nr:FGGY family carbohydrate kinase [Nocardia alni]